MNWRFYILDRNNVSTEIEGTISVGWISLIEWNPNEETASFSLIPKYTN